MDAIFLSKRKEYFWAKYRISLECLPCRSRSGGTEIRENIEAIEQVAAELTPPAPSGDRSRLVASHETDANAD